jgi:hypothetical protein
LFIELLLIEHFTYFLFLQYRGCSQRVALGAKLLKALPHPNTCEFLLEWYFEKSNEWIMHKPTVMAWSSSVLTDFAEELKEPRNPDALHRISEMICRNNEHATQEEFDDYQCWVASFCGANLRWESLGALFAAIVTAILCLPERDAFFVCQGKKRKQFAMEMKDCVQACVTLSNYMDLINMQMVALLAKNMILQTVLSGDTSKFFPVLHVNSRLVANERRPAGLEAVG